MRIEGTRNLKIWPSEIPNFGKELLKRAKPLQHER